MDTENSSEVLKAASETPQQEETVMEKEVVFKHETPEESTEPEKSPAAAEETGDDMEKIKETVDSVVTENVKENEKILEVKIQDSVPKQTPEQEKFPEKTLEEEQESQKTETMPGTVEQPPKPDVSPENIPDPVTALNTEPEKNEPEQQPENIPEPLPVQISLAEHVPEQEPEKLTELVPEAELPEQTIPEPDMMQQPAAPQPPSQEEKVPEQVDTEAELQTAGAKEVVKEVVAEPAKEGEEEKPAVPKTAEVEMEGAVETVLVTEVAAEKPTEAVALEETAEKPVEVENMKPAEDEKKVEPQKSVKSGALKAEPATVDEVVKSEQENIELKKEEATVPAPGSLSFAFLEQEQTKDALQTSRTLIVIRGLPGSGKSFLARSIADSYKDLCYVVCADDHGIIPENPELSADGYKALDEAVVAYCSAGTTASVLIVVDDTNHTQDRLGHLTTASVLIVVDDTNHTQDRLGHLGEIAKQHQLLPLFLEPCTEWNRDLSQLAKKTGRGLEEAQMEAIKRPLEEMSIPLYFGWFLLPTIQDKVRCTSMDFLKTLDTLEAFKKHLIDYTGKSEKEVDLEQYFKAKGNLHCTTKFCNYGKADGAKEYAEQPAVRDLYGSVFELSLSALFVTPRTVGARVSLTEEQLVLWPSDAEKEAEAAVPAAASLPLGSRAHVTLGCAEGIEPVQTGLDLLDILVLQQGSQQGELVTEMELGSLVYYGEGRWLLSLREPICVPACFSSFYRPKKEVQTKKEPEKKKKPKCTIL
ncbi:hypothetical protein LDENG_00290980 [Lucifuga dentata]|nr:hypothetical protein LDENG_00290980 [Lucifuga dentata]